MQQRDRGMLVTMLAAGLLALTGCAEDRPEATTAPPTGAAVRSSAVAGMYALDFVGTAATGYDMNDAGDVVGTSYRDTGCGPFCLPPQDVVVWKGGNRIPLPLVPGFGSSSTFPFFINNQGLIGGEVGLIGSTTHAAVWTPSGGGYVAQDLGVFPGATSADVYGLDDLGRMIGWSTKGGAIPTLAVPFMWTQTGGMVDLAAQGYPNEIPGGMSPGGKVVTTSGHWYQLGSPGSVFTLPPVPAGFFGTSGGGVINDNGDQAHFLVTTGSQNLIYPFRLSNGGAWQQISSIPTGHLSRAGLGSINLSQDISFTAGSTGLIAAGPSGVGQPLAGLISPAYPGATVGTGGPMNNAGEILTQVMIGRSQRLMKMTPVTACGSNCLVSSSLVMNALFVQDPAFPGSCFQGGTMYDTATVTATFTDEAGAALANVLVSGRFLDDYWANTPVSGTTNASGTVTFSFRDLCGVGAIAFLIDKATLGTRTLERTRGVLSTWQIPVIPPPNQPPVAAFTYSCTNLTCTFDGTGSSDPDGTVVGYSWKNQNGTVLSTAATFTKTFASARTFTLTLTVTDNQGATGAISKTITVGSTNQPPIASFTAACTTAHSCTFTSTSTDPDGTIVGYQWKNQGGTVISTASTFTKQYASARTISITLTVTDNGGATGTVTKTVVVP